MAERKSLFALPAGLILVFSGLAQAEEVTEQTLRTPAQLIASFSPPAAPVPFREERHDPLLAANLISYGHFASADDGALVKTVERPFQERLEIHPDRVRLTRNGQQRDLPVQRRPAVARTLAAMRGLMQGDAATVLAHFQAVLNQTDEGWHLALRPNDEMVAEHLSEIEVFGSDDRPQRICVRLQDDSWQLITLL